MKMRQLIVLLALFGSLALGSFIAHAQELYEPVVIHVPDGANTLYCQPATLGQGAP